MDRIINEIRQNIELKKHIIENKEILDLLLKSSILCQKTIKNKNIIYLAGNGGSAADSQHIAAEFISKYRSNSSPLPSIALTTDTSILTAISNDYGYKYVFSRQLEALGKTNDVFIGITTSGKSENILEAFKICKKKGLKTICLTGINGVEDKIESFVDIQIKVPSNVTARIQEVHILIGHIICGIVEEDYILK